MEQSRNESGALSPELAACKAIPRKRDKNGDDTIREMSGLVPPVVDLVTCDGDGFALRDGRIFQWDNSLSRWKLPKLRNVERLRLGADGHAYALANGGAIWRLTDQWGVNIQNLHEDSRLLGGAIQDFAVSPSGSLAIIEEGADQSAVRLRWMSSTADSEIQKGLPLPMTTGASGPSTIHPVSIVVAQDGQLHLLAKDGEAWRAHPEELRDGGAQAWRRIDVPEEDRLSELSVDKIGTIVGHGRNTAGGTRQLALASNGNWHAYDPCKPNALESSYGRFQDASSRLSNVTLGMPLLPGGEPLNMAKDGYLKNKLAPFRRRPRIEVPGRPAREAAGRIERWIDYYRAHYGIQTTRGVMNSRLRVLLQEGDSLLTHPDAAIGPYIARSVFTNLDLPAAFEVSSEDLGHRSLPHVREILGFELGPRIAANAHLALDRIERALGLRDEQGNEFDEAGLGTSSPYWRFVVLPQDAGIIRSFGAMFTRRRHVDLHTDDNVLFRLLRQAERLFTYGNRSTAEERLVTRLRVLIDEKRLKFSTNQWPGEEDYLHEFTSIQLCKIAHDVGVGLAAAVQVSDRLERKLGPRHAERTEHVARGIALDYVKQLDSLTCRENRQFMSFEDLKSFSDSLRNLDCDAIDRELEQDARELASLMPSLGAVEYLHAPAFDLFLATYRQNAGVAIGRLEGALGFTGAWRARRAGHDSGVRPDAAFWQFCQPEDVVWTQSNVLYLLFDHRSRTLHGKPGAKLDRSSSVAHDPEAGITLDVLVRDPPCSLDPRADDGELTARLGHLLDLGIYLPAQTVKRATTGRTALHMPGSFPDGDLIDGGYDSSDREDLLYNALPAAPRNEFGILTGRLVRDQKLLELAARTCSECGGDPDPEDARHYTEMMQSVRGNPIDVLFNKGVYDPLTWRTVAHLQRQSLLAQHPHRALRRAAKFEGLLGAEDQAEHYRQAFLALKVGESLTLDEGWHGGLDGDGTGIVLSLTNRLIQGRPEFRDPDKNVLNIPLNILPNLEWQPYAGRSRSHRITVTRTANGVDIGLGQVSENDLKIGSFKVMWGAGRYAENHLRDPKLGESTTALGLGYAGFEILPNLLGVSRRVDDEIIFTIKNDDHGSAPRIVSQLMSGRITAFDMLSMASTLSQRTTSSLGFDGGVDAHALLSMVGIFTSRSNSHRRFKAVGAGLYQVSGSLQSSSSTARQQGADGVQSTVTPRDLTISSNRKLIGVGEIQGSYIKDGRSPMPPHPEVGGLFELQEKVPLWIDLIIRPIGQPTKLKIAPNITYGKHGRVSKISYSLMLNPDRLNASNFPVLARLRLEAPDVEPHLDSITRKAAAMNLPIQVEVELGPEGLARLNAVDARNAGMPAILDDSRMWRIRRCAILRTQGYTSRLFTGLGPLRYRSEATNSWSQIVGSVVLCYGEGLTTARVYGG